MLKPITFQPIFSALLRDRRFGVLICSAGLLQLALTLFHVPGWQCPFFHALGIPCPGCGMTRAALFLIEGEWRQSVAMHAFAPLVLVALALITYCTIVPKEYVERLAGPTERFERHTGLTTLVLGGLILYWLARLLFMPAAFVRLIQN